MKARHCALSKSMADALIFELSLTGEWWKKSWKEAIRLRIESEQMGASDANTCAHVRERSSSQVYFCQGKLQASAFPRHRGSSVTSGPSHSFRTRCPKHFSLAFLAIQYLRRALETGARRLMKLCHSVALVFISSTVTCFRRPKICLYAWCPKCS